MTHYLGPTVGAPFSPPIQFRESPVVEQFSEVNMPDGWNYRPAEKHSAAISYKGDYVISHRNNQHILSHRPEGKHTHVGEFKHAEEAKQVAYKHAKTVGE